MVYTRPQLLHLNRSPLVAPPPGMPELKHWFGEHESSKKDVESATPNGGRERRFRREAEDSDSPVRTTFRSTMTQPSQMGNFKHHPLRDRDRDLEKGDKEGERLRNLSDKFDRDRLAAPGLRNKERDIAPHLIESSLRGASALTGTRRGEPRDGTKKKIGETNDDWRRGNSTRPERSDNARPDRERPRSRVRDSSRPRRDHSSSRRERDDEREPGDHRRRREDQRRERDHDRAGDKDEEDTRRWRDDGRRDERVATRRANERQAATDKAQQENGDSDRRWTVVEERENRTKRNHRDRRAGGDDAKEERREREREKEKEPAWMETYVPDSPGGIVGRGTDGELDGIQAWKKGLKEKEKSDAIAAAIPAKAEPEPAALPDVTSNKPLNEIEMFRMLMKTAAEEPSQDALPPPPGIHAKPSQGTYQPPPPDGVAVSDHVSVIAPSAVDSNVTSLDPNSLLSTILGKGEPQEHQIQTSSRFFPKTTANAGPEKINSPETFNPPSGSRLLALGTRPTGKSVTPEITSALPTATPAPPTPTESMRAGFTHFDEQSRMGFGMEPRDQTPFAGGRVDRQSGLVTEAGLYPDAYDPANGYSGNKGSRMAKFFSEPKRGDPQSPIGFTSTSPGPSQRPVQAQSAMDGLLSKLNNSAHTPRAIPNLQLLQQQQHQQMQHTQQQLQQLNINHRMDSLYDSRLDDRNFVPDGMVPGLRPAVPRGAQNGGMFPESLDEAMHFGQPRVAPQQNHVYNPQALPSGFGQPGGRNNGLGMQGQFRGTSPIGNGQARGIPTGLANLGGRPPLDSAQYMGMPGLPHNGVHPNAPPPQFNSFAAQPHLRVQQHHPNLDMVANARMLGGFGSQSQILQQQQQQLLKERQLQQMQQERAIRIQQERIQQERIQQERLHHQQQLSQHHQHQHQQQLSHHQQQHQPQHHHQIPQHMLHQHQSQASDLMALLMGGAQTHRE
ncbi:unnamed protein product [Mycena citricolor]|nr:unnamed protein product [Mycena citricolor]